MRPIVTRAEKSRREHKTLVFFLVALEALAAVMLIVGLAIDNDSLRLASYALRCQSPSRCSSTSVFT